MSRLVRATFSNGAVLKRRSVTKVYTHAYLIKGVYGENAKGWGGSSIELGTIWGHSGFSTSEEQCRRNMSGESAWARKQPGTAVTFEEVVAVEVLES